MLNRNINITTSPVYISGHGITASSTDEKIDSFSMLSEGWDCGQGGPISEDIRTLAKSWNQFLQFHEFWETDAFANGGGEVLIAVRNGDHYFEVIIEADHTISIAYDFKRRQVFYRSHMSAQYAQETVREIKGRIWTASEYLTPINIMQSKVSSPDLHLRTPGADYQWLLGAVFNLQAIQSVPISGPIIAVIEGSSENRQFFGVSKPMPPLARYGTW